MIKCICGNGEFVLREHGVQCIDCMREYGAEYGYDRIQLAVDYAAGIVPAVVETAPKPKQKPEKQSKPKAPAKKKKKA